VSRDGRVSGFSGVFAVGEGGPVSFKASLLVTPVKMLNLTKHFSLRYVQLDGPANYSFLASQGASVVNVHQGNSVNPFINYPYLTNDQMNATSTEVHELGMRFSIYNTMRELSNRCVETFAMRALGEAYVPGCGGAPAGADWLKEHVGTDFLAAWSTPLVGMGDGFVTDAAMRVVALSRWNNFYVEGIQQMTRDFALDGIYLDEIAYDRITMMRMRKLLDARAGVIDHHSDSGAFCVSPAAIYNEHYAFIDKLWYGEGFDYDTATPDYWLVEMSGLVFGLTADMLRYSGMTCVGVGAGARCRVGRERLRRIVLCCAPSSPPDHPAPPLSHPLPRAQTVPLQGLPIRRVQPLARGAGPLDRDDRPLRACGLVAPVGRRGHR
jgi:hypothetical protein